MISVSTLYDEYIDRPKLTEKKNPFEYIVPSPSRGVGTINLIFALLVQVSFMFLLHFFFDYLVLMPQVSWSTLLLLVKTTLHGEILPALFFQFGEPFSQDVKVYRNVMFTGCNCSLFSLDAVMEKVLT